MQAGYPYINLACIQPGVKGSIGADSGSGAFRGLGYRNWDASMMKKFSLGQDGRRYMQIRFETYNTFNHTEWNGINLTPSFSPTTGHYQPAVLYRGAGWRIAWLRRAQRREECAERAVRRQDRLLNNRL